MEQPGPSTTRTAPQPRSSRQRQPRWQPRISTPRGTKLSTGRSRTKLATTRQKTSHRRQHRSRPLSTTPQKRHARTTTPQPALPSSRTPIPPRNRAKERRTSLSHYGTDMRIRRLIYRTMNRLTGYYGY
jgi:hypothetical protein